MSYLALARKWRPRSFAELVGQEHVRAGARQRARRRAACTTRSCSPARAASARPPSRASSPKCLNCETGVHRDALRQVRVVHAKSTRAGSSTSSKSTPRRAPRSTTRATCSRTCSTRRRAAATRSTSIDEVHMLSTHSFNALLKTLEEPPPHVKFLLATTDPQKLPVTVLSRCLQFNLKRLPVALISRAPRAGARQPRRFRPSRRRCGSSRRPPTAACAMRCRCSTS